MSSQLSKSEMKLYSRLWLKYREDSFEFNEAKDFLNITKNHLLVTLHRLKIKGWAKIQSHPTNVKKSLYSLISPIDAVESISK